MSTDVCFWSVCFFPLSGTEQRFFGFAEFLSGLALMVLVWTVAEPRYRFRIRTAPLPLQGLTFGVVTVVGLLTLCTDVWRSEKWYVPKGDVLTPSTWQGLLGGVLLATFLVWAWYAFLRPPVFGRGNSHRFERAVYEAVLRGVSSELSVVADELAKSAPALISVAPTRDEVARYKHEGRTFSAVSSSAHRLLWLLADPRFVRAVVETSTHTGLALFRSMAEKRRYPPALSVFAGHFVEASIADKQSYLYHEAEGYDTGLLGYEKPLTSAMFSSYELVDQIDSLLDVWPRSGRRWDSDQLRAYTRITLIALKSFVEQRGVREHSAILYRAFSHINGQLESYKLDGQTSVWENEAAEKLRVAVEFTAKAIEIVCFVNVPLDRPFRDRSPRGSRRMDIYRLLAKTCYEIIFSASSVKGPRWTCWQIQHNTVWSRLFSGNAEKSQGVKLIKHLLRRRLYEDVIEMDRFPNYKGAKIIGFILNVCGFLRHDRECKPLHKLTLAWASRSYPALHSSRPDIAAHCLVDGFSYDASLRRIIFTKTGPLGVTKPRLAYFQL